MQVQKVQNNNYNVNFNAKFEVKGFTNFIKDETLQSWKKTAENIGNDKDSIIIQFTMPNYQSFRNGNKPIRKMSFSAVSKIDGNESRFNEGVSAENIARLYELITKKVSEFLS